MPRLTSKYQLTLPKAVAQQAGLAPGDELECETAGEVIRIRARSSARPSVRTTTDQLVLFDLATERQVHRQREKPLAPATDRGWARADLYER
jgi:bifunctional DNA-binding transcriptional regulator/antitoxin component of YhaV-PrlF toxin-antitoxin module